MISDYMKFSPREIAEDTKQSVYRNYLTHKLKMKSQFNEVALNASHQPNEVNSVNVTSIEENVGSKVINYLNISSEFEKDTSFLTIERQRNANSNAMKFVNMPKEDKKSESIVIEGKLELDAQHI